MKFKNLLGLSLLASTLFFGGCTTTQNLANSKIPAEIKSQLSTSEAVLGYFGDEDNPDYCGCVSYIDSSYYMTPVKDGYYRVLLGRNATGDFLVQDFYQETKTPQSSPAWVKDPMKLFSFSGSDIEGPVTLYRKNGKVESTFVNQDGVSIHGEEFYPTGQRGAAYKVDENGNNAYRLWYASGKIAAEYVVDTDGEYVGAYKAWQEDGREANDDIDDIRERVALELD
ncbi:hypothetical protein [Acinetobacter sp.]|uniref:hypothetical protein n=1 Tax=Acinetobacter sp. TaxID=472 RepID=UPI0028AD50B1|nr:hypothetical protein [Acinetobacter sp.]